MRTDLVGFFTNRKATHVKRLHDVNIEFLLLEVLIAWLLAFIYSDATVSFARYE